MTKAELFEKIKDWPDDTVISIGSFGYTKVPGAFAVDWNGVDGERSYGIHKGMYNTSHNEFCLWPANGSEKMPDVMSRADRWELLTRCPPDSVALKFMRELDKLDPGLG